VICLLAFSGKSGCSQTSPFQNQSVTRCGLRRLLSSRPGFSPERFYTQRTWRRVIHTHLKPIATWLANLCQLSPPIASNGAREAPAGQLSLFEEHKHESLECLFFHVANSLVDLGLPLAYLYRSARPLRTVSISKRTITPDEALIQTRRERAIYTSVRRYLERTYLPGHHQCVRIAWNDLTVSSISGSRFVAWHPEVCPTAQAFVRWQREYPWEDLKNPFYQRYSRRVHLVKLRTRI
jgi:hypothetical protein